MRETAEVRASLGVGGLDGLSKEEVVLLEQFARSMGSPDIASFVSGLARNYDKSEEEGFAVLHVALKKARAMSGSAAFDSVLSSAQIKHDSSPRSGAHIPSGLIPRAPSVSGRVFPPNGEVDAHHMRLRQAVLDCSRDIGAPGSLFYWEQHSAEKANFREAAGVSLEEMSPVTLDSLLTGPELTDCKLMLTVGLCKFKPVEA